MHSTPITDQSLFGIPKAIIVVLALIALNLLWAYIKRLKRRAEAADQFRDHHKTSPTQRKAKDDQLGEYVDYEEIKD